MSVFYGTLTSKGQTTIPVEVRDLLNLKAGDKIRYLVRDGEIVIKAKNKKIKDLAGRFFNPDRKTIALDEMEDTIAHTITDRVTGKS
jgi:antitoxin PrlF